MANQAKLLRRNVWRYVDGLTDDELLWEPALEMWGLRLKTEVRTDPTPEEMPPGDHWVDVFRDVDDQIAPFTTIGWRRAHLILGTWNWNGNLSGVQVPEPPLAGDADSLVTMWGEVLDSLVEIVAGFRDRDLEAVTSVGASRASVISHVTVEIACHSAEIGTVRHLKRAIAGGT